MIIPMHDGVFSHPPPKEGCFSAVLGDQMAQVESGQRAELKFGPELGFEFYPRLLIVCGQADLWNILGVFLVGQGKSRAKIPSFGCDSDCPISAQLFSTAEPRHYAPDFQLDGEPICIGFDDDILIVIENRVNMPMVPLFQLWGYMRKVSK